MSTSMNVHELQSPHDRTRGLGKGGIKVATGLLIAVGLVLFVFGIIHLNSLISPADLPDLGQFVAP
jgi:hypothetical protein